MRTDTFQIMEQPAAGVVALGAATSKSPTYPRATRRHFDSANQQHAGRSRARYKVTQGYTRLHKPQKKFYLAPKLSFGGLRTLSLSKRHLGARWGASLCLAWRGRLQAGPSGITRRHSLLAPWSCARKGVPKWEFGHEKREPYIDAAAVAAAQRNEGN